MLTTFVAFLLFSLMPERDLRPELEVFGRVNEITVSPGGDLWIGTATGSAYRSEDGGRSWSEPSLPVRKVTPETVMGDMLDRFTFFDAQRAILSGYIGEEQDRVLVTADGGATWTSVSIGEEGFWVYDLQAMPNGHAWLVGSNGSLHRSDDFGQTWMKLTRPFEDDGERTMSVSFATSDQGVVGTLFSGDLAITSDGGKTWRPFLAEGRDAVEKGCGEGVSDKRVNKIRLLPDRVVIEQCGGVFSAPLGDGRTWTRVTADGKALVMFDTGEGGSLIGLTEEREVVKVEADGTARLMGMKLERMPSAMSAAGNRVALIDATMKVTRYDGEDWLTSRMFGKGIATEWPVGPLDRGKDEVLWGASSFYLYCSTDGATTWDRIAELPAQAAGLAIQQDGDVLIWDGHGWVGRWVVAKNRFSDVSGLSGLDISGSFRRKDVWLLYGGRQYDTAGRVEVAQTFVGGQFAGSVDYGFVAASTDGGRSWSIVDRWDEGPQALFLADDGTLTLLSWLCGVRQGKLTLDPPAAKMETLLKGEDREHTPYVQQTHVLNLLDPKRGSLFGWIHHIDNVAYETRDGGRTWSPRDTSEDERVLLLRLFDGRWLGLAPPKSLQLWNGKRFETISTLPGEPVALWVDSLGELSMKMKDGSVMTIKL